MLHFCSVDDIKLVMNTSSRFEPVFDQTRKSVTALFRNYMRRDISFSDNVIEHFDSITLASGQPFYITLGRKPVVSGSVRVKYGPTGIDVFNPPIDYDQGKITLYGPMRFMPRGITVQYAGGYPAKYEEDPANPGTLVATDVMDAPEELRLAAIKQAKWMLDGLLNQGDGKKEQPQGRGAVEKQKTIQGLIPEVARMLDEYRKTFMRVI